MITKKLTRIVALALVTLMLVSLSACSSIGSTADVSVEIITSLIYKDSDGNRYSVPYKAGSYLHSIAGIHTFSEKIPSSFDGYVLDITVTAENTEEDVSEEDEYIEKLNILTADYASSDFSTEPDIYLSSQVYEKLGSSAIKASIMSQIPSARYSLGSYVSFNIDNCTAKDIDDWQAEFDEKGQLKKSFNYKQGDTDYAITVTAQCETYKLIEKVTKTYEISGDYTVVKTPYFDSDGKKVATSVSIVSSTQSVSYIEY